MSVSVVAAPSLGRAGLGGRSYEDQDEVHGGHDDPTDEAAGDAHGGSCVRRTAYRLALGPTEAARRKEGEARAGPRRVPQSAC